MPRCLISLGSNLGDPLENVLAAARMLVVRLAGDSPAFSRLYRTPPIGGPVGQKDFINAVMSVETHRNALEMWQIIREVESVLGRQRQQRWEARCIDLDILLYDDLRLWTPRLKIPHPRFCTRKFLLEPACEIAAHWIDPVSEFTIAELDQHLKSSPPSVWIVSPDRISLAKLLKGIHPAFEFDASAIGGTIDLDRAANFAQGTTQLDDSSRHISWSYLAEEIQVDDRVPAPLPHLFPDVQQPLGRQLKLLCVAAKSPESSTVAWEDYSQDWAQALGILEPQSVSKRIRFHGPRYLLDLHDIDFAAHEIRAAMTAMNCEIEPVCEVDFAI